MSKLFYCLAVLFCIGCMSNATNDDSRNPNPKIQEPLLLSGDDGIAIGKIIYLNVSAQKTLTITPSSTIKPDGNVYTLDLKSTNENVFTVAPKNCAINNNVSCIITISSVTQQPPAAANLSITVQELAKPNNIVVKNIQIVQ